MFVDSRVHPLTFATAARRHWLRLCLVSRAFLHAARRFLYKKPLSAARRRPTDLLRLAETLHANHRYLGKLVIDLSGVGECYELLEEREGQLGPVSFPLRGFSKAFSWVITLLSTCTNCRIASAAYSSQNELKKVLRTMAASLPGLRSLELRGYGFVADNSLLSPSYLSTLTVFKQLSELHLVGIPHGQHSSLHSVPQLPVQPTKLVLCEHSLILECSLQYFPVDGKALTDLDISFGGDYEPSALMRIVRHTPQLVKLRLRGSDLPVDARIAEWYGTQAARAKIPLEFFGTLPKLVHLELRGFVAFSTQRLRLLAATSPRLKYLSGVTSIWIADDDSTKIFEVDKVADVFPRFKHLESAHLGYLPRLDMDDIRALERVCDGMGAVLVYEWALPYLLFLH